MRFIYTPEMLDFLRREYQTLRGPALTVAFNNRFNLQKTYNQIRNALKNNNITCGRQGGFAKGERIAFDAEKINWLTEQYKTLSQKQLTADFNARYGKQKTVQQLVSNLKAYGIKSGRSGCFKKGHTPINKNTKGLMKPNKTSFKKGDIPPNSKPLGHERICKKDGYILVKIAEKNPHTGAATRYRAKHIVIWQQANGPVPPGKIIVFKDHDRTNCTLDNLECISKSENCRRNKLQLTRQPPELQPVIKTLAKLQARTSELKNRPEEFYSRPEQK